MTDKVAAAIRAMAAKMPTYITLKDVKKRWGHGQEDVFPVAQFEKLWGDMTALPEVQLRLCRRSPRLAASSSRTRPSSTAGSATDRRRMWNRSANGSELADLPTNSYVTPPQRRGSIRLNIDLVTLPSLRARTIQSPCSNHHDADRLHHGITALEQLFECDCHRYRRHHAEVHHTQHELHEHEGPTASDAEEAMVNSQTPGAAPATAEVAGRRFRADRGNASGRRISNA